jgi:hypothetical protein
VLDGVPLGDRSAQFGPSARIERSQLLGEAVDVVTIEEELARQQIVEDGIGCEHG